MTTIMYVDLIGHIRTWLQWTLGEFIVVRTIALSICTAGLATPIANAMVSYGVSTLAFAGIDTGFDSLGWWLF